MTFQQMQTFFKENKGEGIWCHTELLALNLYFYDDRSRLRTFAPPEEWVWRTLEVRLLRSSSSNQIQGREERAHAAAKRSLLEGLKKLRDRAHQLAEEEIRKANSVVITGMDDVVIRLLRENGFPTKTAIAKATDTQLKAISGIDRARLRQIRRYCPHVSERTARQLAAAQAGQGSLF